MARGGGAKNGLGSPWLGRGAGASLDRVTQPIIRVAVVDDHDAVRLGLRAALLAEPDLEPVGSADSAAAAERLVLFSAFAEPWLTVPAIIAGVDAIVDKGAQTRELFEAIRRAAGGKRTLPAVSPALLEVAGQMLDPDDLPILGMLVGQTAPVEIASTLRISRAELERRIAPCSCA